MTSKMDKIRKAMEELNIKDNLVRVFKDKSTMIWLKSRKNIKISNNQSVEIR